MSKNPEHYQKRYNEIRIIFTKNFLMGSITQLKEKPFLFMLFYILNKILEQQKIEENNALACILN